MVEPALFSSARQDWATPSSFIEWLRVERSVELDLDAAALHTTAKAPRYFGPDRTFGFGSIHHSVERLEFGSKSALKKLSGPKLNVFGS